MKTVVREYVGTGPLAELAAEMDALQRLRRKEEAETRKAARREECERLDALEAPVEELCKVVEVLTRAALLAAGYRMHNRGEWRKRRGSEVS